ncbi:MAG TPA: GNAT family N-acetyltransferase [Candidatus Angelobacter sp.]|jgi:ribosomal protein S18 acetylase RimI-like enzyme
MKATLRPARAEDQDFLFKLYASTRAHEIAAFGWPEAQQEAFLRLQFTAQQRGYESTYPQAEHQIVELDGMPIGRIMVHRDMVHREMVHREKGFARLVDISLLAEHCGHGIGSELMGALIRQCTGDGATLKLQVRQVNPAVRLYERLGFIRTSEDAVYIHMERRPE